MAEIIPFKGVRYNQHIVKDLSLVTAPPYDVISNEEQERYYQKHPDNIIRLLLGKEQPGDNESENKYIRAEKLFRTWQEKNILIQDDKPVFYYYRQIYSLPEANRKIRDGFLALVRLEDPRNGKILPHEKTLSKPVADRMKLLKTCQANFSPIFTLFPDKEYQIDQLLAPVTATTPLIDLVDDAKITHQLWVIESSQAISLIQKLFEKKTIYIADGHHRYETSLRLCQELQTEDDYSPSASYNYIMMYLTNMYGEGITILPAHRLLKGTTIPSSSLLEKFKPYFEIRSFPLVDSSSREQRRQFLTELKKEGERNHTFGFYSGDNKYHLLTLRDEKILEKLLPSTLSPGYKRLDVTILHSLILHHIMGVINGQAETEHKLDYLIDTDYSLQLIREKSYQMGFFLNPTHIDQVANIAQAGEKMPGKATYFYPKLLSGLVINKF